MLRRRSWSHEMRSNEVRRGSAGRAGDWRQDRRAIGRAAAAGSGGGLEVRRGLRRLAEERGGEQRTGEKRREREKKRREG